jgi:hypothetical protein
MSWDGEDADQVFGGDEVAGLEGQGEPLLASSTGT